MSGRPQRQNAHGNVLLAGQHLIRAVAVQVIDDVANMGFSRHEVKEVVLDLMNKGQSVDLNIVLDRLMHGRR